MAKDLVPFADMTIPGAGFDILGSSTRKAAAKTNIYEGKVRFNAVIIKSVRPTVPFTAKETASRAGQPQAGAHEAKEGGIYGYRVRIIDDYSPHAFLPDPCDPQVSGSANELIMDMHTLAYSKRGDLNFGDQVIIQLDKSNFSYNLDYAEIVERIYSNKERFIGKKQCSQPMDFFAKMGTGIPGALPDIAYNSSSPDFYAELRMSPYFKDFSDQFLVGLTANAQAESNFVNAIGEAGGDLADSYAGEPEKMARALPVGDPTGKCSHGFWQMNVCNGAGQQFLAEHGIDPVTQKAEAMQAFEDKDKQFAFVAKTLKDIFGTGINETDPGRAASEITLKFERPKHMEQRAKQRAALAKKIFSVTHLGAAT